ncbi:hypothetical protein L917_21530, partial [Phytophthora nicotianae]
HALKYQTISTPDGLITHLYGPFPGRNHDIKLFKESRIASAIQNDERFKFYRVYGDQAYGNDGVLASPFTGAIGNLPQDQKLVNKNMSRVRVSVEWRYGQVVMYWTALDFKRQSRSGTQPVGTMYRVGVLLSNCMSPLTEKSLRKKKPTASRKKLKAPADSDSDNRDEIAVTWSDDQLEKGL